MTIKVYDSKVYGKTVYMRYGMIENEGCTVICVGCTIIIVPFVPYRPVPHVNVALDKPWCTGGVKLA